MFASNSLGLERQVLRLVTVDVTHHENTRTPDHAENARSEVEEGKLVIKTEIHAG